MTKDKVISVVSFVFLVVTFLFILKGCHDDDSAKKILTNSNFKEIKITGYRFFGCDKSDLFHTGFEAINQNNVKVTGVVCKGFLKGSTIRFDD